MHSITSSFETLSPLLQREFYEREGYSGPFPLSHDQSFASHFKKYYSKFSNYLLPNAISKHTAVRRMALLGNHPQIIHQITKVLGKDVLLWGSQVVKQLGGKKKRFHVDAEFCAIEGASVWIAVENVVPKQSLFLISGSHVIETSPQELNKLHNLDLNDAEAVLAAPQDTIRMQSL